MNTIIYKRLLTIMIGLILTVATADAQTPAVFDDPGGETGGDGNGSFGDGPVVPLDGGMSCLLLSAAVGYGIRVSKKSILTNIEAK